MKKCVYLLMFPFYLLSICIVEAICLSWCIWYYDTGFTEIFLGLSVIVVLMTAHYLILWKLTGKGFLTKTHHILFTCVDIVLASPLLILNVIYFSLEDICFVFVILAEVTVLVARLISGIQYEKRYQSVAHTPKITNDGFYPANKTLK